MEYIAGFSLALFLGFVYSKITGKSISLPGTGTGLNDEDTPRQQRK